MQMLGEPASQLGPKVQSPCPLWTRPSLYRSQQDAGLPTTPASARVLCVLVEGALFQPSTSCAHIGRPCGRRPLQAAQRRPSRAAPRRRPPAAASIRAAPATHSFAPSRPYWAGKAPDFYSEEAEEPGEGEQGAAPAVAAGAALPPAQGADPRLLRLTQRQGVASGRRGASEAVVVRRRARSPEVVAAQEQAKEQERQGSDAAPEEEAEAEDEDAIAARRMAIRARQLAASAQAAATAQDEQEASLKHCCPAAATLPECCSPWAR